MNLSLDNLGEIQQMLKQAQNEADLVLSEFDFNDQIDPSPEKRQLLNVLLESVSSHLMEVSHVDSFLKSCDLFAIKQLSHEQHTLLLNCQTLCQSLKSSSGTVLRWVLKMKKILNDASCPVQETASDENGRKTETFNAPSPSSNDHISSEMVKNYYEMRDMLKEIHNDLLYLDPNDMTSTSGRRLNVMDGRSLFIETEHEMNVFVDYCIFQYCKGGKNIVERYFDLRSSLYKGRKLDALTALKNTRFSFLKIIKPADNHGLVVHDALLDENLMMIDKGLHQVAKKNQTYSILTHYLCAPGFAMTTGASTPVLIDSEAGEKMQTIFNKLVLHHHNETLLDNKTYKQCITDLYKTAIHSDATKTVASRELPMNYHQPNGKTMFTN
jgi:hypothetical protein